MKQSIAKHNVNYVKRLAKKIKKEENLTHHQALNLIAKKFGFKNWKHFYNENKNITPSMDSSAIPMDELIGLCLNGFSNGSEKFDPKTFSEVKKIEKLRIEIKKYFKKTESFNLNRSSYGLKHDLERHIGEYVANGELIYAMYMEGYKIKRARINCYFNISSVGLKNLTISNRLLESLKTSSEYELEAYSKLRKKFIKYKYHFNLIIWLLLENEVPKKNIYGVIGAEIGETSETIKQWFAIEKGNSESIPVEKLESLSEIFGIKSENLENF